MGKPFAFPRPPFSFFALPPLPPPRPKCFHGTIYCDSAFPKKEGERKEVFFLCCCWDKSPGSLLEVTAGAVATHNRRGGGAGGGGGGKRIGIRAALLNSSSGEKENEKEEMERAIYYMSGYHSVGNVHKESGGVDEILVLRCLDPLLRGGKKLTDQNVSVQNANFFLLQTRR